MDNSEVNQNNDPVFSSTNLADTKARSGTKYFTNVQKATLGQRISAWFANLNRNSQARSDARRAAFKAKMEARRRAADLAAISAAVPNATPAAAPQQPAQQPQPTTIIIEGDGTKKNDRKKLFILIGILAVLIISLVIILIAVHPWDTYYYPGSPEQGTIKDEETGEIVDIDIENAVAGASMPYVQAILDDANVYAADKEGRIDPAIVAEKIDAVTQKAGITDEAKLLLFDLEKARIYLAASKTKEAWGILEPINESVLTTAQADFYYYVMYLYYIATAEPEKATAYSEKQAALPTFEGGL